MDRDLCGRCRQFERQHTIALLTHHAFDRTRSDNRDIIERILPAYDTRLTAAMVDFADEKDPVLKAIDLDLRTDRVVI